MLIPCCDHAECPDVTIPTTGYESESPDQNLAIGYNFGIPGRVPALNSAFAELGCVVVCEADTQQEADICAANDWLACVASAAPTNPTRIRWPQANTDNQPPVIFFNHDYSIAGECPDGVPFTILVPAGTFSAFTQAEADAIAQSFAQMEANRSVCLTALPPEICFGTPTTLEIDASGGPFQFSILSGDIPSGMVAMQTGPSTFVISGTPNAFGQFSFVVGVALQDSSVIEKPYTINVIGIASNPTLPDAIMSQPFLFSFLAGGTVAGALSWSIVSGTVPPGLTLSTNGSLSGIPTQAGHYSFVVQMKDSDASCKMVCNLNVHTPPPCVALINANTFADDGGNFIPQTMTATHVDFQMPEQTPTGGLIVQAGKAITNNTGSAFTVTVEFSWNAVLPPAPYDADIINNGQISIVVDGLQQCTQVFNPANLSGNFSCNIVVLNGTTIQLDVFCVGVQGFNGTNFSQGAVSGTADLSCQ